MVISDIIASISHRAVKKAEREDVLVKNGEDLIIKVPEGTVIYDDESGKVIADMSGDNMKETILKGGRGGKG